MKHLEVRPIPPRRKRSDYSTTNESYLTDDTSLPEDNDTISYKDANYHTQLALKGSFMHDYQAEDDTESGPTRKCQDTLKQLLDGDTNTRIPQEQSLFQDEFRSKVANMFRRANEAKVLRYLTPLLVPSVGTISCTSQATRFLGRLVESVDELWTNCIPLLGPRPKPDYAVGFGLDAFTESQRHSLDRYISAKHEMSYFMGTDDMFFPFLACEVKGPGHRIAIAECQNAHSMTLAVRGVVELFRLVKRAHEVHCRILGYSIYHNHSLVSISGHYAVISGEKTTYYQHEIHMSNVPAPGDRKWTPYKFVTALYNTWAPKHLELLCSAINDIPNAVRDRIAHRGH